MRSPLAADTNAILEALERHKEVRGTLELFDALWTGDPAQVQAAAGAALNHPLSDDVGRWLEARGAARPSKPTNEQELQRRGVTDVALFVDGLRAELAQAKRERDDALLQRSDALKTANGLGVILFLVAGAGVLGWLAAFGAIDWAPLPLPERMPESGDGSKKGEQVQFEDAPE